MAAFLLLSMSSCVVNSKGDIELTWLFWAILISIILPIFVSYIRSVNKASERGITVEQQLEEEQRKRQENSMARGLDVYYLGGYPKWPTPCKVGFSVSKSTIMLKKGSEVCSIAKEDVVAVSNEKSSSRSAGKTAAGAIVGGVLTGRLGLLVGGAIGARKSDTSELYLTYKYNGIELTINLRTGKNTDKIYSWIASVFA